MCEKALSAGLKIFTPAPASIPTERQPGDDYCGAPRGPGDRVCSPPNAHGRSPVPHTARRGVPGMRHPSCLHRAAGGRRCARRTCAWRSSRVGYCLPQIGQMNSPISTGRSGTSLLRGGSPITRPSPPRSPRSCAPRRPTGAPPRPDPGWGPPRHRPSSRGAMPRPSRSGSG